MLNWILLVCLAGGVVTTSIKKPNFVVIMTDDQDSVLGGMAPMQNVERFIGKEGMTFSNSYTTSPICCPSRASFLTGLYVHNHMTYNNSRAGGCYSKGWPQLEENSFATVLKDDGYNTFYAGKYLNQYGVKDEGKRVPPGWSNWHGLIGNSVYYNYTISHNGVPKYLTDLYLTDVIKELAVANIENQTYSQPFLMMLAPPAPHQPFTPAPRHRDVYRNTTAMRNPTFNVAAKDKHWLMSMPPSPLPESLLPMLDEAYRSRWEALLAVDEMVADVIDTLDRHSLLDNTYIIYTSDNGYHIGQFSQVLDKRQPYETDIKVPLLIRGPGIDKDVVNDQPVLNIDIAPTILKLAGISPPSGLVMDGHPIDTLNKNVKERNMLIEYHGEGGNVQKECPWWYDREELSECRQEYSCKCQDSRNNTFACIRHIAEQFNMKYCMFPGDEQFTEIYDLKSDPNELTNIVNQVLPAIKHWYHLKLLQLLGCKGAPECDHPLEHVNQVYEAYMNNTGDNN